MAGQTLGILFRCRRERFRAEIHHARERPTARFYVRAPRSVTGLALQAAVAKGAMRVIGSCVLGAEDAGDRGIVVTPETGIGALRTVGRIGMRRTANRRCNVGLRGSIGCERVQSCAQQQSEHDG